MASLRVNSFGVAAMLCLCACASSSYREVKSEPGSGEVVVTPDRVSLNCEDVQSELGEFYGFSIFVLDDKDSVLSVVQTNMLDKESCEIRISKIGKILTNGRQIRIYGIGNLDKPRTQSKYQHDFKGKGRFRSNDRVLQFLYILNENGGCYDAYSADEKPCPQNQ